jgi:DmsE family decaheme c-type cytochrome
MSINMSLRKLHKVVAIALVIAPISLHAQTVSDGSPEYSRKGADTCIGCHGEAATLSIFQTKHGVPGDPHSPFGKGQLQCEACHGPGGNHAGRVRRGEERPPVIRFGKNSEADVALQNGMCLACHEKNAAFKWHGSAHDDQQVACADCHQVHNTHDPVRTTASQPPVCFGCHQQQHAQALKPYSHPLDAGKMDCSGCHKLHGTGATNTLLVRQTLNDTCFECHAEKRGPYLWEHAPVAEDCSNCHEPHGSSNPGMLSMRGPMLCQSCHSQAGHPSIARDADGLAGGMPSPYLLARNCLNCHSQVHGSNHPSGSKLMR